MNGLPSHLVTEILFRMDPKSLAKMQCTGKSFCSRISNVSFKSEYFSRAGSSLLHISSQGSNRISYLSFFETTSPKTIETLKLECQILGSCSGLLLLFIQGLCIANPITKQFQFLDYSRSKLFPMVSRSKLVCWPTMMYIGFAVDQIDSTTQRFKIVCINDRMDPNKDETMYQFEISVGDSWRLSKTTITCRSNDLDQRMKPVYADGSLHWLRKDGSIIAFNLQTEQARLIPVIFPKEFSLKTLFMADNKKLALISATNEVIYVYTLINILTNPMWILERQIRNVVMDVKELVYWELLAYDGKYLMLRENEDVYYEEVVHRYNIRAEQWEFMGLIPGSCDRCRDFYQFKPSFSSAIGLKEKEERVKPCDKKRISSLSSIIELIVGNSSVKLEI